MHTVRYKMMVIPPKDVRINFTILLTWISLTLLFMFGLFFGHGRFSIVCMLLMFFSLLCSIPVTLIIKSRTRKKQTEVIKELQLVAEEQKLYSDKIHYYVKYDEMNDNVHLYTIAPTRKGMYMKTRDIILLQEENNSFLSFCRDNSININNSRNYVL